MRVRDAMLAGALAGVSAGLVFATAHAFIIVPIWDRMWGSLFGAAFMGAVIGWSYAELYPSPGPLSGPLYGLFLWLSVVPVSLADALLRATGVLPRLELLGVAIAVVLAVVAGGAWGWRRTQQRRGMIAGAAASLALTLIMGGPVPIGRSVWALGIFLAVLPATVIAGAILSAILARLTHADTSHGTHADA